MASFIVDASAALAWCFSDEATSWTDGLLERIRRGDQVLVPAHWPLEISNSLIMAVRRKRIPAERPGMIWNEIALLTIAAEPPPTLDQTQSLLSLSQKHGLTVYDAAYLELAQRLGLPLATLDIDLRKASQVEGITLL
jgi:predicted nucleic acid-binding protein